MARYKLKIKEYRKLRRLTQKALAARVGISRSFLSEIENEKYDIKLSLLEKISEALECNIIELFEYIPNKK